jgi:hypothetical protein
VQAGRLVEDCLCRASPVLGHHSFASWEGLDHAVRTGEPGFREKFRAPLFDYLGAHPELAPVFDAGMTCTVLRRYPNMHGKLFDLNHVVARSKISLQRYGVRRVLS